MFDPEDRFENHVADTLAPAASCAIAAVVEMVVREVPARIRELIALGPAIRRGSGLAGLGREGGHSHDRIVHALGDATGREVMRAVIDRLSSLPNIETWQNTFTLDLLTHEGACRGRARLEPSRTAKRSSGPSKPSSARAAWARSIAKRPIPRWPPATAMAFAYRAGAELRDMEFMQFHPTVLYIAGCSRSLITEAMRGAGALPGRSQRRSFHAEL